MKKKKKMEMKMKLLQIHPLLPMDMMGRLTGFSSTWNPTRPIIEMKFGQVDCNIFQFLKKSTKMEKIVFLYLLLTYLINPSNPEFRVPKSITTPYHFLY